MNIIFRDVVVAACVVAGVLLFAYGNYVFLKAGREMELANNSVSKESNVTELICGVYTSNGIVPTARGPVKNLVVKETGFIMGDGFMYVPQAGELCFMETRK